VASSRRRERFHCGPCAMCAPSDNGRAQRCRPDRAMSIQKREPLHFSRVCGHCLLSGRTRRRRREPLRFRRGFWNHLPALWRFRNDFASLLGRGSNAPSALSVSWTGSQISKCALNRRRGRGTNVQVCLDIRHATGTTSPWCRVRSPGPRAKPQSASDLLWCRNQYRRRRACAR
jgi:hypothetical protein